MRKFLFILGGIFFAFTFISAQSVSSTLKGRVTVKAELDAVQDYQGFHVLIGARESQAAQMDTLGFAVTDKEGRFSMQVKAKDRGIYPLMFSRRGQVLAQGEIVVGNGDNAEVDVVLPATTIRVRSTENAAWWALKNIRAQHKKAMLDSVSTGHVSMETLKMLNEVTANLLWGMDQTFEGKIVGVELARVESVVMLVGWNDSLAVARGKTLAPDAPGYVDAVKSMRRAVARMKGQKAAIEFVAAMRQPLTSIEKQADLYSEIVQAYVDSTQRPQALATLAEMKTKFTAQHWVDWIARAEYEVKNLLEGSPALMFKTKTAAGQPFDLAAQKGKWVVLEYWSPRSQAFVDEIPQIQGYYQTLADKPVTWVGIALEPDKAVYDAFVRNRPLIGTQILEQTGTKSDAAKLYNINVVPVRILIDPAGNIVGKYSNLNGLATKLNEGLTPKVK
jgi:peroxiredoxin